MRWPRVFAGRPAKPVLPEARFAVDRLRIFDADKTRALATLLTQKRGLRDAAWHEAFFDAAWNAALVVSDPAVFTGPDGFPYVRLNLPPPGRFRPASIANLAALCLERATGIALFASAADPAEAAQFLFPMGTIDSLMRFDTWLGDPLDRQEGVADSDVSVEQGWGRTETAVGERRVMLGSPSVQYLPVYTARALLKHMRVAWQIADPRVRLMVDPMLRPSRTLVVGRKLSSFPDGDGAAQCSRLLWYLPQGRSVTPMPEDWQLADMTPLEPLAGQAPAPVR